MTLLPFSQKSRLKRRLFCVWGIPSPRPRGKTALPYTGSLRHGQFHYNTVSLMLFSTPARAECYPFSAQQQSDAPQGKAPPPRKDSFPALRGGSRNHLRELGFCVKRSLLSRVHFPLHMDRARPGLFPFFPCHIRRRPPFRKQEKASCTSPFQKNFPGVTGQNGLAYRGSRSDEIRPSLSPSRRGTRKTQGDAFP